MNADAEHHAARDEEHERGERERANGDRRPAAAERARDGAVAAVRVADVAVAAVAGRLHWRDRGDGGGGLGDEAARSARARVVAGSRRCSQWRWKRRPRRLSLAHAHALSARPSSEAADCLKSGDVECEWRQAARDDARQTRARARVDRARTCHPQAAAATSHPSTRQSGCVLIARAAATARNRATRATVAAAVDVASAATEQRRRTRTIANTRRRPAATPLATRRPRQPTPPETAQKLRAAAISARACRGGGDVATGRPLRPAAGSEAS